VNLSAIANGVITAINPNFPATLFISLGNTVVNFKQVPSYNPASVAAQVQPLTSGDLRLLDALNIQGAQKAIYLNGTALAISRVKQLGGDLITFADGTLPEGNTWLVLASLEQWANWCRVAVSLQDDIVLPPPPAGTLTTDLTDPSNEVVVPLILTGV
jgi:hypothetical protein